MNYVPARRIADVSSASLDRSIKYSVSINAIRRQYSGRPLADCLVVADHIGDVIMRTRRYAALIKQFRYSV